MKTIAAILAGGSGKRVGNTRPKQFLEIAGRTVVERSVDAFEANPHVDEVVVVMHPDHIDEMRRIADRNHWKKLTRIVAGGKERHLSSVAALACCDDCDDDDRLIIHDAARPLVSQRVIDAVAEALDSHPAVGVGVPATDTIWAATDGRIASVPDRSTLWCAQTPQAFRLGVARKAYSAALNDPDLRPTDDCGVVLQYLPEVPVHIVAGDPANIKITYAGDVRKAETLLPTPLNK